MYMIELLNKVQLSNFFTELKYWVECLKFDWFKFLIEKILVLADQKFVLNFLN